jgi:hypothetical protein
MIRSAMPLSIAQLYHNSMLHYTSQWQGSTPHAEFIEPAAAALWLLNNEHDLPEDLRNEAEIIE